MGRQVDVGALLDDDVAKLVIEVGLDLIDVDAILTFGVADPAKAPVSSRGLAIGMLSHIVQKLFVGAMQAADLKLLQAVISQVKLEDFARCRAVALAAVPQSFAVAIL